MTAKARSLGMRRTTFRNASGLPNSKQVSTARDLATLSRRLMHDHAEHYHYFSAKKFVWNGRTYRTHNSLVKTYDGAEGLKTGYTRRSGYNLATSAQRDGHRLVGIVLGGRSTRTRDAHMRKILDKSFANIKRKPTLIAALHRKKPSPRMKPTLVAQLALEKAAPTVGDNDAVKEEVLMAAADFASPSDDSIFSEDAFSADQISALIAAADPDDFNEFERVKLSALGLDEEPLGQGDIAESELLGWNVQIGAYSSKAMAQSELEAAAIAANLVDRARKVTPIVRDGGDTIFRARFVSLDEADAVEVCDTIRAAALACFVLQEPVAQ